MSQPAVQPDLLDAAVDHAIGQAGGDLVQAIRNLARRQHELEDQIKRTVSAGYVRRKPSA